MKRILALLLIGVMCLAVFPTLAQTEEPVTITFWDENAGPNRTPYLEEMIARFEEQHPTIKVQYVGLPWSDAKSKYDVAIQSKTTPDVGGIGQDWISDFTIKNALLAIDDMYESWAQKDDLVASYIEGIRMCAPDGKLYALSNTANIPVIWYRPDRLEAPETWEDIFASAEATADVANNIYGFSIRGGPGGVRLLIQMMYSYSGISEMFDEDGNSTVNADEHVAFLERLAGMYNRITPESDITNGYKEMVAAFDTGVANMICHNLGSYGEHMKTLGEGNFAAVTGMKSLKGNANVITDGSVCYGIFSTTQHPEEAFTFASFLCEAEQSLYWNQSIGQLPTSKAALESDYVKSAQHITSAAATTANPTTTIVSTPIYLPGYADLVTTGLEPKFQQVLLGENSAQDFLDYFAEEMNTLKQEYDQFVKK